MAQTMTVSWHDALKFRGFGDGGKEIASEVRINVPEWTGMDRYGTSFNVAAGQQTSDQDFFEGLIRKETDPIDPFRYTNEGVGMTKGVYERTLFKLHNATHYFWVDRSIVKRNPAEGAKMLRCEGTRIVEDVIRALGKQFFYGGTAAGYAKGFQGLQMFINSDLTFKAGGTAAASGDTNLSSAYFVRFNPLDGVSWLFGRDGAFDLTEPKEDDIEDANNTGKLIPVIKQMLEFYPGFGFFSKYAAARICNIAVGTSLTPGSISTSAFTDEHLLVAEESLKGAPADVIFMSRRAGILLAASRQPSITIDSNTITSGQIEIPREYNGIPICYTDSLGKNEPVVS